MVHITLFSLLNSKPEKKRVLLQIRNGKQQSKLRGLYISLSEGGQAFIDSSVFGRGQERRDQIYFTRVLLVLLNTYLKIYWLSQYSTCSWGLSLPSPPL
jgi:hypothetical protein